LLILNADDFGLSPHVNSAVLEAFERRLITSATVMPTAPAFDAACAIVREKGLERHVGAHLVLTSGSPLTEPLKHCQRFCDTDGTFHAHRSRGRILHLSRAERRAVSAELEAQIAACRARGVPVTHLDSHHHVHTELGLGPLVVALARRLRVPYVRLARNTSHAVSPPTRLNRTVFNARLRRHGLAATRFMGDVDDYVDFRDSGASAAALADFEVMVHPVLDDAGGLVDLHSSQPGARTLAEIVFEIVGLESAVSFAGVRYEPVRADSATR
jgi:hypothetical protein